MGFPWTLQRYIFREMGRTFLLTSAGLTAVLGFGGGVMNMMKLGEVSPSQLFRLMALFLPVAAALTLPVAALFSATSTYGRLSADNEFVACRSSGINMHKLLFPTLVLSLLSGTVTFAFTNFVIPGMVQRLNEVVGYDITAYMQQKLREPRGITLSRKYHIHADAYHPDPQDPRRGVLEGVSFLELDDEGSWARYGTARAVELGFERLDTRVQVWARMVGLSYYDKEQDQFVELAYKSVAPNELPARVPEKLRFLDLGELFHYLDHPAEWREAQEVLHKLRRVYGQRLILDSLVADWQQAGDRTIVLASEDSRIEIASGTAARQPRLGGIELGQVTAIEQGAAGRRVFKAERAVLELASGETWHQSGIKLRLYSVAVDDGGRVYQRAEDTIGPLPLDPSTIEQIASIPDDQLLAGSSGGTPSEAVEEQRAAARKAIEATVHGVLAVIHQRLAFSVSVFVLVLLGAALAVILRGSHVLTAFGISFVPSLFVIMTIVMGNEMAQNAITHAVGLGLMWSGLAILAVVDVYVLFRVLRR